MIIIVRLMINTYYWKQGTHDIIDYNNREAFPQTNYTINYPLVMQLKDKRNQTIEIIKGYHSLNNDNCLFKINIIDNGYYIFVNNLQEYEKAIYDQLIFGKCAWLVYKKHIYPSDHPISKANKYKLQEGDIIKIGRVILLVKKIQLESLKEKQDNINQKEKDIIQNINKINVMKPDELLSLNTNNCLTPKTVLIMNINKCKTYSTSKLKKNCLCRICLCEETDSYNDPLIRPCLCIGSLEYLHYYCLKQWLRTKTEVNTNLKSNQSRQYLLTEIECEICKGKYPDCVRMNHKIYDLFAFDDEYDSYISLETIAGDSINNRYLYFASFVQGDKVSMGRDNNNDIVISDISASHLHSVITKNDSHVYIEDCMSKFGTLILVQVSTMKMLEGQPLNIQIGKLFFSLIMKKYSCICCDVNEIDYSNSYAQMNSKNVKKSQILVIKEDNDKENHNDHEDDNKTENDKTQLIDIQNKRIIDVNRHSKIGMM